MVGGLAIAGDGAPEVADGLFGEKTLEVIGRLDDLLGGSADEFESGGRFVIEEDAGAVIRRQRMINLALGSARLV